MNLYMTHQAILVTEKYLPVICNYLHVWTCMYMVKYIPSYILKLAYCHLTHLFLLSANIACSII